MKEQRHRFLCAVCALALVLTAVLAPAAWAAEGTDEAQAEAKTTLTAADAAQMQQADAAVTALTGSEEYELMSREQRRTAALDELDELAVPAPADVTLEDLSFGYTEDPIFAGLDLTAHPGEIIGITGPVACGKSTLGRVFLCEASYGGSARFGGKEFSALTPREIAATVGYLGHDPELSADTVQNNVLCGSKQDPMPWLAAVALKDEVQAMENGVDTVIGPSGTRLSGGQAQRLALARTLAHPRPVLVLDDPFSALDRSTEDTVFANLQEYAKDKAVFLISHRLYHFPQMQHVIFMEDGKTTVGTHEELLAAVPAYRQLYESQTGGQQHENEQ